MTDEDIIQLSQDLSEMVQNSKGYKRLLGYINDELTSEWDMFIRLSDSTHSDFIGRQSKCQTLCEVKSWIEDSISKGRSLERSNAIKKGRDATILQGTGV